MSEADSVKVTVVFFVAGALPLMTTEPVGARLSTVTEIAAVVAVFPDVSRARACSVCVPFDRRRRIPGKAVRRGRVFRAEQRVAVQQELHAADGHVVRRRGGKRHCAQRG